MSKKFILAAALLAASLNAGAQDTQFKWYGFIRNYAVADSRESVYGTEDFFYYLPKARNVGRTSIPSAPSPSPPSRPVWDLT